MTKTDSRPSGAMPTSTAAQELAEYRGYVERVAHGNKPSDIILNRSAEHAAVIFERLFEEAHGKVRILTGNLNSAVYGTDAVIQAAIAYVGSDRSPELEILVEEDADYATHPLVAAIRAARREDQLKLWQVPKDIKDGYTFHFAVTDDGHFRFEKDRKEFFAIVQFSEDAFAPSLRSLFDAVKSVSKGLPLA